MNFILTHSLPIFLILVSLLLALIDENIAEIFMYNRNAINNGELWRLITTHLTHLGWNHLWLNLLAVVIIWFLVKDFLTTYLWWLVALISSIGISIFLYLFMPELQWYVGLSGLLHSLLICGGIIGVSQGKKEFILLLLFVLIKIIYEQFYGSVSIDIIERDIILNAHIYGASIGLFFGLLFVVLKKKRF